MKPTSRQITALNAATPAGWRANFYGAGNNYIIAAREDEPDVQYDLMRDPGGCVRANYYTYTTAAEWNVLSRICQRVWHRGLDRRDRPAR